MRLTGIFLWKEAPFLRLFPPFLTGIIVQQYCSLPAILCWLLASACMIGLTGLSFQSIVLQFRMRTVTGALLNTLLFTAGSLLTYYNATSHQPGLEHAYKTGDVLLVTIEEPLSEKAQSYKTTASLQAVINGGEVHPLHGKLLLYFQKDSTLPDVCYGQQLLLRQTPERIRNTGNPGAFDYVQYCADNGIFYQVYLQQGTYTPDRKTPGDPVKRVLYRTREKVLNVIRENIAGKKQAGLAEALLIGYKDELDKTLLQSYTDTGVVHIIAVSGLHLGLIYGVLLLLCKPLHNKKATWLTPVLVITGLWLFAFLAGGVPSVLRSAIMFSFLAIGKQLPGKPSVYNSLAASAFLLLCYNPLWWRDPGFQLSYTAVLSIVVFFRPIYNSLFVANKYLDMVWKAIVVTIAAQVLTTPISIYYFHQFPNLFLVTNLLAIPLSSLILMGELVLCAFSWIPVAAKAVGWLLYWMIRLLNSFIETIQQVPFNTTGGLQLTLFQELLLYIGIGSIAAWWLLKKKNGLWALLATGWLFTFTVVYGRWQVTSQEKLIVYNIPKCQAIDFIQGRQYVFKGDPLLLTNSTQQNFHLKPSRTLHHLSPADSLLHLLQAPPFYYFGNRSLVLVDKPLPFNRLPVKIDIDCIVLSHNARVTVKELATVFNVSSLVIDASNSRWKTSSWKQDCQQLGIPCHAVAEQGAFVLSLH
jgi:competence protein ComEC